MVGPGVKARHGQHTTVVGVASQLWAGCAVILLIQDQAQTTCYQSVSARVLGIEHITEGGRLGWANIKPPLECVQSLSTPYPWGKPTPPKVSGARQH